MRTDCQTAVEEALGRPLGAGEARKIEDAVSLQMRLLARKDPQAWAALSSYDRLQQGAQAAAGAMVGEVRLKQQRLRLQIAAHDRLENALNDAFERLPENAKPGSMLRAVSQLLAFDAKGKGLTSVETWAHAIQNEALGRLMPLWDSVKGFAGLFENAEGVKALTHELFHEDTGNAAAKEGVKAWEKVTDELRDRANAAGMDIGKLDEWRYPQSHSQARIAQAGLDKWTEATLPALDRTKYLHTDGSRMSDDDVRDFLRNAYDSIITDGQNKVSPGQGRPGYGSIANRQSASRQIFFKDADSYINYQGQYGDRNLWTTLTGHIRSISRDIALVEHLGPNAEATFRYFNDRTRLDEIRTNGAAKDTIHKASVFNEALYDYVSGKRAVVNQKVADVGQAFRNFETATKLGKVVITALGDEAGMAATAFANRVPWSESFAREFTYLNPANSEDRAVASHAGLGINGAIGGLNRFGYEDLQLGGGEGKAAGVRQFTSKLANGVMHASGAEAMWDARRRALGSVLMSYLGKTVGDVEHFSDINVHDHGILANKGVTEDDWQVWKRAQTEDWGMKHGVLTPKSIGEIPDEKIDEVIAPRVAALKADADRQISELNSRDAQERDRLNARADELSQWVREEQARFSGRVLKDAPFALRDIQERLSKLTESLEYAKSYWRKPTEPNMPGIENQEPVGFYGKGKLRSLGVDEGRAIEEINSLKAQIRDIGAEMRQRKSDVTEKMFSDFYARQAELNEFADRAQARMDRRATVIERIQNSIEPAIANERLAARRHASTMLLGHVLEETGMGVMDTGARERAGMFLGTQAGTVPGELMRAAMLFKSFSFSMMQKHWARAASMPTATDTAHYVARLVVMGTVMGALATQLRNLVGGKDPANIAEPQFWAESLLRGGGLGFYGDFLYSEATQHDTTLIPALMGPLATELEGVKQLTIDAAFKKARGERTDEGAKLLRFAKGNIPFLNMWYTQAALDHLVWNDMQEAASPGYLDRTQAKAYANRGTTWWWQPGEQTPSHGPDFAKAWQPERGREQMSKIAEVTGVDKVEQALGAQSE